MSAHTKNNLPVDTRQTFDGLRIHFMGIGGIGVSALAEIARRLGAAVSGCDRTLAGQATRLMEMGIPVACGHDAGHVKDCDLLVYSSAIPADHPERLAAKKEERRGQFLARLLDVGEAWGVCGTHGKTTTAWLTAQLLLGAGRDPSVFIGGIAADLEGGNYRLGTGPFVSELDESDETFLLPRLQTAVVTNIESDHLSHYGGEAALFAAFGRFAAGVAADGLLIAGIDNAKAADVFRAHDGRKLSFGFAPEADLRAAAPRYLPDRSVFELFWRGRDLGEFSLPLAGAHNVRNALAALGAALENGVGPDAARRALSVATGVGRRMERLGMVGAASVYSDYAHHPTEVEAAIAALRQRHAGRLLVVFQPHLYSRTRDYADAFARALSLADEVILTHIYAARELPLDGVGAKTIAAGICGPPVHGPIPAEETPALAGKLADGFGVVAFLGAGDIDGAARMFATGDI